MPSRAAIRRRAHVRRLHRRPASRRQVALQKPATRWCQATSASHKERYPRNTCTYALSPGVSMAQRRQVSGTRRVARFLRAAWRRTPDVHLYCEIRWINHLDSSLMVAASNRSSSWNTPVMVRSSTSRAYAPRRGMGRRCPGRSSDGGALHGELHQRDVRRAVRAFTDAIVASGTASTREVRSDGRQAVHGRCRGRDSRGRPRSPPLLGVKIAAERPGIGAHGRHADRLSAIPGMRLDSRRRGVRPPGQHGRNRGHGREQPILPTDGGFTGCAIRPARWRAPRWSRSS